MNRGYVTACESPIPSSVPHALATSSATETWNQHLQHSRITILQLRGHMRPPRLARALLVLSYRQRGPVLLLVRNDDEGKDARSSGWNRLDLSVASKVLGSDLMLLH